MCAGTHRVRLHPGCVFLGGCLSLQLELQGKTTGKSSFLKGLMAQMLWTVKEGGGGERESSCWELAQLGNAPIPACGAFQMQGNQLTIMLWPCTKAEGITESSGLHAEKNPQQIPPPQKAFFFRRFSLLHVLQSKKPKLFCFWNT